MSPCPNRQSRTPAWEVPLPPDFISVRLFTFRSSGGPDSTLDLSRSWLLPCLNLLPGQMAQLGIINLQMYVA